MASVHSTRCIAREASAVWKDLADLKGVTSLVHTLLVKAVAWKYQGGPGRAALRKVIDVILSQVENEALDVPTWLVAEVRIFPWRGPSDKSGTIQTTDHISMSPAQF